MKHTYTLVQNYFKMHGNEVPFKSAPYSLEMRKKTRKNCGKIGMLQFKTVEMIL